MSTGTVEFNPKTYSRILAKARPTVLRSDDEHERLLTSIEALLEKGEQRLTPEEDALLELLLTLVHDYENKRYPLTSYPPHEMVAYLLDQRGMKPSDLWTVIGSKGRVSEILSGKRAVSKEQARQLARFFNVGVELFI